MTTAFRDSARFALRDRTAACHARIDAAFGRLDLTTPAGLATFLAANHAVLSVLEPILHGAPDLPALPPRLPALEEDLAALGHPIPCPARLDMSGHDRLGIAYVVGGSALGGRVLERRRAASADPAVRSAGRFMDDPRMMPYWASVQGSLRIIMPGDERFDGLVKAAEATFGAFGSALREVERDVHD